MFTIDINNNFPGIVLSPDIDLLPLHRLVELQHTR